MARNSVSGWTKRFGAKFWFAGTFGLSAKASRYCSCRFSTPCRVASQCVASRSWGFDDVVDVVAVVLPAGRQHRERGRSGVSQRNSADADSSAARFEHHPGPGLWVTETRGPTPGGRHREPGDRAPQARACCVPLEGLGVVLTAAGEVLSGTTLASPALGRLAQFLGAPQHVPAPSASACRWTPGGDERRPRSRTRRPACGKAASVASLVGRDCPEVVHRRPVAGLVPTDAASTSRLVHDEVRRGVHADGRQPARWRGLGRRSQPKIQSPRKVDSRKNATSPSSASSGAEERSATNRLYSLSTSCRTGTPAPWSRHRARS